MSSAERERGEEFYRVLDEHVLVDHDGWAFDLVQRVAERLQQGVAPDDRLQPVVVWIEHIPAFTMAGRYVYFSRFFLQRGLCEEAAAFVFAHELAHHRLGHVRTWLADVPGAWVLGALVRVAHGLFVSPEKEAEADRWAIERCVAAGYDRERCLTAFDAIERLVLDAGGVDTVFGDEDPERLADQRLRALDGEAPDRIEELRAHARKWLWQRRAGYLSVRERRATLAADKSPLVNRWRQFLLRAS
jgi:predicted Zn-dependent protease